MVRQAVVILSLPTGTCLPRCISFSSCEKSSNLRSSVRNQPRRLSAGVVLLKALPLTFTKFRIYWSTVLCRQRHITQRDILVTVACGWILNHYPFNSQYLSVCFLRDMPTSKNKMLFQSQQKFPSKCKKGTTIKLYSIHPKLRKLHNFLLFMLSSVLNRSVSLPRPP